MHPKDALGRYGEDLARRHLESQGCVVLARNWRTRGGELDLVVRDGDALVVVEVKTRRGEEFGDPLEAITRVKLARLRRLAATYVGELDPYGVRPREVRIDAVGVVVPRSGRSRLTHVRGVG